MDCYCKSYALRNPVCAELKEFCLQINIDTHERKLVYSFLAVYYCSLETAYGKRWTSVIVLDKLNTTTHRILGILTSSYSKI